jgi:hypothetical protein
LSADRSLAVVHGEVKDALLTGIPGYTLADSAVAQGSKEALLTGLNGYTLAEHAVAKGTSDALSERHVAIND